MSNKIDFKIEEMSSGGWKGVAKAYMDGINTSIATFQADIPTWEEWDNSHIKVCRLVARLEDKILGFAALSPTSSRCVYKGVAEVSIYIGNEYRGEGVGTALLTKLVEMSEKEGFWTLQSGIIRENTASIEIHKKCGFRELGVRERVGKMNNGVWHDVILMERRSKVVGID